MSENKLKEGYVMKTIRDAKFVPEWMDMEPMIPEPKIDWIEKKYLDIAYGDDPLQKLDLYYPDADNPVPLVVVIHGGGWCCCDKRDWHLYPGFYALEKGFAVASVNYRLSPAVQFPKPLEDVKAAIMYLRDHAGELGIRKEDIFLYGTSAGGNLAALAGLQNAGTEYAVSAVAALCPLIDFENQLKYWEIYSQLAAEYVTVSRSQLADYLGSDAEQDPAVLRAAGTKMHITKDAPPFYIQHGTLDPAVPFIQSCHFAKQLREVCKEEQVVLDILENTGHAGGGPEFLEAEHITPILEFFLKYCSNV